MKRVYSLSAACLLALAAVGSVQAQGVDYPARRGLFTEGEFSLLPPYCRNIMGFPGYNGPEGDRWRSMLGEDFQHFHHYCRGLRDVNYARTAVVSDTVRRFLWQRSISEYEYMIRNSKPTMVLMPEIYFRMGESYLALGRLGEAQAAFETSRRIKPDYWPAYTAWIDELLKLRQYRAARELAEQGLQHLPKEPQLKSRHQRAVAGAAGR